MGTMKTDNPWGELNMRQQQYMLVIYEVDQESEKNEKEFAAMTKRSRPADEWRWLRYGIDEFGKESALLSRLKRRNLVDPGTGSTLEALEARDLILMKHDPGIIKNTPWIRMTTKGRKLVRTATKEIRPKKQPVGTLREWHWKALSLAYRAHIDGKEGVYKHLDKKYGDYGGLSWNTWLRLRDYKVNGKFYGLVKEYENCDSTDWRDWYYVIRVTPTGLELYAREWDRYRQLYPEVDAPQPVHERMK